MCEVSSELGRHNSQGGSCWKGRSCGADHARPTRRPVPFPDRSSRSWRRSCSRSRRCSEHIRDRCTQDQGEIASSWTGTEAGRRDSNGRWDNNGYWDSNRHRDRDNLGAHTAAILIDVAVRRRGLLLGALLICSGRSFLVRGSWEVILVTS